MNIIHLSNDGIVRIVEQQPHRVIQNASSQRRVLKEVAQVIIGEACVARENPHRYNSGFQIKVFGHNKLCEAGCDAILRNVENVTRQPVTVRFCKLGED
eukprot:scaffold70721_cov14-Prasinocladus_malaysianus.AAC.2